MSDVSGRRPPDDPAVAIIGAGISGICLAIRLKRAGIDDFVVLEKADALGGTWRDNTYPGCACDVPSYFYCYSFEPKPDWSHTYSPQAEILAYLDHCAEKYGLRPHVRLGEEVREARYDEAAGRWQIETASGRVWRPRVLVAGCGQLNRPFVPDLPGLEGFEGIAFHSAEWRWDVDLEGLRVAAIGNGPSAVQFIPDLARTARKLSVFQRTPNWVMPRPDVAYSGLRHRLYRTFPLLMWLHRAFYYWRFEVLFYPIFRKRSGVRAKAERLYREYLESEISDPEMRAALLPDYPAGCKRIVISSDFYPALRRDNVELVTSAIERVTPKGIVTADGVERPLDAIVFGTGFRTTEFLAPMEIRGREGRRLHDAWSAGAEAYMGMAVAGFPNLFLMYGPNTNLGHNSIIFMIECQARYIERCVREILDRGLRSLEVREEAMARFNERLQRDLEDMVWTGDCQSWYKTDDGKVTNNWSGSTLSYWWRTRRPDFSRYRRETAAPVVA